MHLEPKCITMKHKCLSICITPKCLARNPFICDSCENQHQKDCQIIPYKQLVKKFHIIQGLNKKDLASYQQDVEETFRILMQGLKKQFVMFRQQFQNLNITEGIRHFYNTIKSHKQNGYNGAMINDILNNKSIIRKKYHIKPPALMWSLSSQLIQLQKQVNSKLPYYYTLEQNIREQNLQLEQNHPNKQIQKQFRLYRNNLIGGMLQFNINNVQNMFPRQFYNIQRLYRASDHNFSAKQFHAICDGKKNTLTIAKTQFGNIVAGFTSLPWSSPAKWQYFEDPSNQTFIFSLSKPLQGLKFIPFKRQFSVGMHKDYGPCFGDDLVIYDKSDSTKSCWSNFPDCYVCKQKEIPHDLNTIKQFVGVSDHYGKFNIKQWQVYKISFSKQQAIERSFMEQYRKI